MYSISRLARQFNLSRSTLLYYAKIGLLKASGRSPSNYRIYSKADRMLLEQICMYRQMGISLLEIKEILDSKQENTLTEILKYRLKELNVEIQDLRNQQQVIISILKSDAVSEPRDRMNKKAWTSLLRAAGLDNAGMHKWHEEFEKRHPHEHQNLLISLWIPKKEIKQIRDRSRKDEKREN